MDMAEVIRRRRAELGLSQADLAKAAGVDARQIRRYEAGQQQPVLSVAVAIANALGISVSELAGAPSHRVSLTGDWWTCWQTARGDVEDIRTQPVHLDQHGELRLWDNEILLGGMPPATARSAPKAPCTSSCTPRHPRRRPMGRD
jgi:transcriptional regulator with XRE-family HTH domain